MRADARSWRLAGAEWVQPVRGRSPRTAAWRV